MSVAAFLATPVPFRLFGPRHLSILAGTAVLAIALVVLARGRRGARLRRPIALGLAAGLIVNELLYWGYQFGRGAWTLPRNLPLQLCDVVVVLVAWALCQPQRRRVGELAYVWGLAATPQGLLTPDLSAQVPRYICAKFFLTHGGVVIAVVYLAAGLGWRPLPGALRRVWLATNLYAVCVGAFNALVGTNYLYLCAKPAHASLLDYFGPWPWYIASMEAAALVFFGLCLAPYWLADRRAVRRSTKRV